MGFPSFSNNIQFPRLEVQSLHTFLGLMCCVPVPPYRHESTPTTKSYMPATPTSATPHFKGRCKLGKSIRETRVRWFFVRVYCGMTLHPPRQGGRAPENALKCFTCFEYVCVNCAVAKWWIEERVVVEIWLGCRIGSVKMCDMWVHWGTYSSKWRREGEGATTLLILHGAKERRTNNAAVVSEASLYLGLRPHTLHNCCPCRIHAFVHIIVWNWILFHTSKKEAKALLTIFTFLEDCTSRKKMW